MSQSPDSNGWVVQPDAAVSYVTETAVDRPLVCQRCSTTFTLASSLRIHAAHVHEEGLHTLLVENDWLQGGVSDNHGDTTGDVNSDVVKREVCDLDSVHPSTSLTDTHTVMAGHCETVPFGHFGNYGDIKEEIVERELYDFEADVQSNGPVRDTQAAGNVCCQTVPEGLPGNQCDKACDIKVNTIKRESPDFEMDSVQSNASVTDTFSQAVTDVYGHMPHSLSDNHGDTTGEKKTDMNKQEVCNPEADSAVSNDMVTERETQVKREAHLKLVSENSQWSLPSAKLDVFANEELTQPKNVNSTENGPHICQVCKETFDRPGDLMTHGHSHTEKRFHACDVCSKTFQFACVLKRHMSVHTGDRPYSCNVCKKTFKRLSHLKEHDRNHTGDRPYSCKLCKKAFKQLSTLKAHEHIHTGDRPYVCNVCKKAFANSSTLKKHELIHTGDRRYVCNVCKKAFIRSCHLKAHERIHTGDRPYVCNVCKKNFTTSGQLKSHERIHTGHIPYSCKVCKKAFKQLSTLKAHERIHTGDRPYVCNVCKKSFATSGQLKKHERIHTT